MERLQLIHHHIFTNQKSPKFIETFFLSFNSNNKPNNLLQQIIEQLQDHIQTLQLKQVVYLSKSPQKFSFSSDFFNIINNSEQPKSKEIQTLLTPTQKNQSCIIMKGQVTGIVLGFAPSCKYKVAFPSTSLSMSQDSLGYFPDLELPYVFSLMKLSPIGLFIAMTGRKISGAQAYYLGLATHFVEDEQYEELIQGMKSRDIGQNLMEFHKEPLLERSEICENLQEIQRVFSKKSFNKIIEALEDSGSEFGENLLQDVLENCPICVKTVFPYFNVGLNEDELQRGGIKHF